MATYIATSLDGGKTFSPETYANPQNTATDAITGQTVNLGPLADNQSSGNPQTDAAFGFGNQMGLAVSGGQIFPVWAGNLNQSFVSNGTVFADPLNIFVQPMAIAAGPRIINSSMGPIPLAEAVERRRQHLRHVRPGNHSEHIWERQRSGLLPRHEQGRRIRLAECDQRPRRAR